MIEQSGISAKDNHIAWSLTLDKDGGVVILLNSTDGCREVRVVAEKATVEFIALDSPVKPR